VNGNSRAWNSHDLAALSAFGTFASVFVRNLNIVSALAVKCDHFAFLASSQSPRPPLFPRMCNRHFPLRHTAGQTSQLITSSYPLPSLSAFGATRPKISPISGEFADLGHEIRQLPQSTSVARG